MTALPQFLTDERLRLILFGGKGGVGKTTTSLASAIHIATARPTRKVLVVSTDPAHSLADGVAGSTLPANLTVLELDAPALHLAFMQQHGARFGEIAARGTFLDRADIDHFLALSLPGLDELMAYVQIAAWLAAGTYDSIVVDTAPTGHTLRLLAMPTFIEGWLGAMDALMAKHRFMRQSFGRAARGGDPLEDFLGSLAVDFAKPAAVMADAALCRFVPVMIAEAMSVAETTDLVTALDGLKVAHPELVINRVMPADDGSLYADVRRRQSTVLRGLPPAIAGLSAWVFPQAAAELRGVERLATVWDTARPMAEYLAAAAPLPAPDSPGIFEVDGALPTPPASTRLLLFAGKGGVGKTTLACASAVALADSRAGLTLLVSTDPAHSVTDCLGVPVGPTPAAVQGRLWAMELDAEREFAALKTLYRDEVEQFLTAVLPGMDLSFDREVMERVLDLAPPGLDEVMALIRVTELLDAGKFELIVLDTAPTGHLLRLLELPRLIEEWIAAVFGVLLKFDKLLRLPKVSAELVRVSRGIKKLRGMLGDATRCQLHPVTIATEMALAETTDLVDSAGRIGIAVGGLLVNQVAPRGGTAFETALAASDAQVIAKFRARFTALPLGVIYRRDEPVGLSRLSRLGASLYAQAALKQAA